jgi:antitoxin component HigA of HigAB toxin-antitoxin module
VDIRPIRNDNDHREALIEIDRLWKSLPNTPDGDKLDVLVILVEAYEAKCWPLDRYPRAIFSNTLQRIWDVRKKNSWAPGPKHPIS